MKYLIMELIDPAEEVDPMYAVIELNQRTLSLIDKRRRAREILHKHDSQLTSLEFYERDLLLFKPKNVGLSMEQALYLGENSHVVADLELSLEKVEEVEDYSTVSICSDAVSWYLLIEEYDVFTVDISYEVFGLRKIEEEDHGNETTKSIQVDQEAQGDA